MSPQKKRHQKKKKKESEREGCKVKRGARTHQPKGQNRKTSDVWPHAMAPKLCQKQGKKNYKKRGTLSEGRGRNEAVALSTEKKKRQDRGEYHPEAKKIRLKTLKTISHT